MKKIFLLTTVLSVSTFFSCKSNSDVNSSSTEVEKGQQPEEALVTENDIVDENSTISNNTYMVIEDDGSQKQKKVDANEQLVSANELPVSSQNLITQNFGNVKILNSIKQKERNIIQYKVQLENGTKLEFDENGEWNEVKNGLNNPIPTKFISENIVNYIDKNYPKTGIEKIERTQKEIKVELLKNNSPDLIFDLNGNFIKKD